MNVKSIGDFMYYNNYILGRGSFSVIYKGYRISDNMPIAVKKITRVISQTYLKNEVSLMKSLNHPNIIKLYDVIYEKDKVYMILEYCNGGDLSKYIRKNKTLYDSKYFYEILEGLKYLNNNQIMHRDIKPANILIHEHTIKITDFGFAKSFEKHELSLTFCGSPLYMSPEILKHSPYTNKSDLWSLGVILYELIVKEHPYYVTDAHELMNIVNKGYNIDLSKIRCNNYREIIKLLLERDVNDREDANTFFNQLIYKNDQSKSIPIPIKSTCINQHNNEIDSNNNSPLLEPSSAPLNNYVLSSYLDDKMNEIDNIGTSMPLYGSSPILQKKSDLQHILNQSAKSISNLFNFKL
jgi:serine/threonine protein kinase